MTLFLILLIGSAGGIAWLYLRHRADLNDASLTIDRSTSYPALFIYFMNGAAEGIVILWRTYVLGHILRFTEKRLRWIRIVILKIERLLFRATHRLRNAVQKHENDVKQ